jgi:hypothetical protein
MLRKQLRLLSSTTPRRDDGPDAGGVRDPRRPAPSTGPAAARADLPQAD